MEVIYGTIPSKSNSYRIITVGTGAKRHASLMKTPALKKYEDSFYLQCSSELRNKMIEGFFELYVNVYYPSNRSDLDGALKCLLDSLQKVGAIKNDNKCVKIVAQKFIDKERPRVEFELKEVNN